MVQEKIFLSVALAVLLFGKAILKEGIMGNIHVKLYRIWASDSKKDVVYRQYSLELWQSPLF